MELHGAPPPPPRRLPMMRLAAEGAKGRFFSSRASKHSMVVRLEWAPAEPRELFLACWDLHASQHGGHGGTRLRRLILTRRADEALAQGLGHWQHTDYLLSSRRASA